MQAYAEGFEIMHASDYDLDLAKISGIWRYGSVVRSWLLDLLHDALSKNPDFERHQGLGRRFRRGPLDGPGGDRPRRARPGHHALPPGPLPVAAGRELRGQGAGRAPQRVRRPRGEDRVAVHVTRPAKPATPAAPARPPRRRRPPHGARAAPGPGRQAAPGPEGRRQPAPRGAAPRAHAGPRALRPLRRHRRPGPPQGRPGPLPALADEPPAPRVHPRRRRPAAVRRTRRSGPSCEPRSSSSAGSCRSRRAVWEAFAERITYHRGDFGDQALYDGLATRLDELDARAGHARQPLLLPGHAAVGLRRDHRRPRAGRARPRAPRRGLAPDRHREAVRARPDERDPPEPRGRQGLPGVAGLPHRPLPGQGDGPQHPRLPLRERDLRADLAPALRRPRPDHGGRVDRGREARLVLRGGRAPRATSSRTT